MTEPLRHVVASTDFSEPAASGVAWAREIARAHGATLHLVHAVDQLDPRMLGTVGAELLAAGAEQHRDLAEEALRFARERLDAEAREMEASGLAVTAWADFGQPSQVVLRAVHEHAADLVVTATRGFGGFRHLLLGSTAERVVQRCEVPVLSVHRGDRDGAGPIRRLLVPTDFSDDAHHALRAAVRVFRPGPGTTIHLLHVVHLPPEYQVYRADGLSGMSRGLVGQAMEVAEEEIAKVAAGLDRDGATVETEVTEGDPADIIVARADDREVDLIAMGTHGAGAIERLFLGTVARRVVQHGPCPVLTVRHRS
ncbi:MAG: universal stress protein [Acidobacteriota bacterium]